MHELAAALADSLRARLHLQPPDDGLWGAVVGEGRISTVTYAHHPSSKSTDNLMSVSRVSKRVSYNVIIMLLLTIFKCRYYYLIRDVVAHCIEIFCSHSRRLITVRQSVTCSVVIGAKY